MILSRPQTRAAVRALHRVRRRRRVEDIDWVDVAYKVYMSVIFSLSVLFILSAVVGDQYFASSTITRMRGDGPAWLGLLAAVAAFLGLRSGSRGGPLAIEAPDVTHVLVAPVDRALVLRSIALRQVRGVALVGILTGAVAGNLTVHRVRGAHGAEIAQWIVCGAAFGLLLAFGAWGTAILASGRRMRTVTTDAIGVIALGWSAFDVAGRHVTSPFSMLGALGVAPLDARPTIAVGVALVVLIVAAGLVGIAGTSIEACERRSGLVGQLRFAATIQDVRAMIVLHRQLSQELPRNRPWFHLPPGPELGRAAWRRDWHGILRWPPARIGRVLALGAIAGASAYGAFRGTTPLLLVAGLALFVAALDAVEPLAQEMDHPDVTRGVPQHLGDLYVNHLLVPGVVMVVSGIAGVLVAAALDPARAVVGVAVLLLVPAAIASVAGAAFSVTAGAPKPNPELALSVPEMATMAMIMRQAFPPLLAAAAILPVLVARSAAQHHHALGSSVSVATLPALLISAVVFVWIRTRSVVPA